MNFPQGHRFAATFATYVNFMTRFDLPHAQSLGAPRKTDSTISFGRHRMGDVPTSAVQAGASVEPHIFRHHEGRAVAAQSTYDEPQTLIALVLRPYVRVFGRSAKGAAVAGLILLALAAALGLF